MFDLTGKTAVVTGGTGVLGSVMCRGLAQAGASVAVLATTEAKTLALAEEIRAVGGRAIGVSADVLDPAALQKAAEKVLAEFGQVDILVNGAGGNRPQAITNPQQSFFDLPP